MVTGCSLGRRSLKYVDYGKVAATFVDLETGAAVRVCARDDSRAKARELFPEIAKPHRQQMEAYKVMNDDGVVPRFIRCEVNLEAEDLPGLRAPRTRIKCEAMRRRNRRRAARVIVAGAAPSAATVPEKATTTKLLIDDFQLSIDGVEVWALFFNRQSAIENRQYLNACPTIPTSSRAPSRAI